MRLTSLRGAPAAAAASLLFLLLGAGCAADGGSPASGESPRRIVSLSPTATETLFAIGAGDRIVAVDGESDFPPSAPRTQLSGFQPNVEAIATYRPDLVVVSGEGTEAAVRGLRKLGVRVLVQPAAASLAQAYGQLRELGSVTGKRRAAAGVAARMRKRIARAVADAPSGRGLAVYHELSPDFFSADSSTFIGRLYRLFGVANVADAAPGGTGGGYPQLSAEHVVSADPDLVVLADVECCGQSAASVRRRPGWGGVDALANGGLVEIDDDIASRWGPRVPLFAERIGAAIAAVREGAAAEGKGS